MDNYLDLLNFMKARHQIFINRYEGKPKPWTDDPILQKYRFCNIYRELDTVTEWIANEWRTPHQDDPDLWFAMCVARFVNWPDTLAELDYPVPWNPKKFIKVLHDRKARSEKVFTGAYMISAGGVVNGMSKAEYVAHSVLTPLWQSRKTLRPQPGTTLNAWHEAACRFDGMGSFMAAQVVADFKYAEPFLKVPDWYTFAASGPGSRRGLNRVIGRTVDAPWKEVEWRAKLLELYSLIEPLWANFCEPKLHCQDLQNANCEYDKYCRVRNGEGKPRSLYPGV